MKPTAPVLVRQLAVAAELLEAAGDLAAVHVECAPVAPAYVVLSTQAGLPLADQRSAVDRIAAVLGTVPVIGPVTAGRHGASVRGVRDGLDVVAVTNAAPTAPAPPRARTTTTAAAVAVLRALLPWARTIAAHADLLIVHDHATRHTVSVQVANTDAVQLVLAGLVRDEPVGRRHRALLPTGHILTVSVVPT